MNSVVENRQYVVFRLGKEEYGIDIQMVATIEKIMQITRVPKTPEYVRGVINLRGDIIPIVDLRIRFNLPPLEETEDTRIIIVKLDDLSIGMVVDSVDEVVDLMESSIESVTNLNSDLSIDYINGVGKIEDRIITLLNLVKLFALLEKE